jgi:hypothetical protein
MTWARFNKPRPGETRDNSTTPGSTPDELEQD